MTPRRTARMALTVPVVMAMTTAVACTASDASLFDQDRLVIGVKNDQPGTGYTENTNRTGFDVELARQLTDELTDLPEPYWEDVVSEEREAVLQQGRADVIIATFSITGDREENVDFVGPYARTKQGFLIHDDDASRIRTLDDLQNGTICTLRGTTSWEALMNSRLREETYEADDASDCLADVRDRDATAMSTDQLILYGFASVHQELHVPPDITIGALNDYGIGLPEGHDEDCARVTDFLKEYVTSGEWDANFRNTLSAVIEVDPLWQNHFRPDVNLIDAYSCQD